MIQTLQTWTIYQVKNTTNNMEIKTVTYRRVLNLRNYESKSLEMFAELHPGDNADAETSHLMEQVERKISEQAELAIEAKDLRKEIGELNREIARLKSEKDNLTGVEEPDPDDIPFDPGTSPATSKDSDVRNYF
ncbi:MAG: hypothetical protein V7K40_31705 [Nostoc sp.]|uniref:hypothetical protein n=1 Tax=Nostoc sp. TaxID=1180 RepID=UPI002FF8D18D